MPDPNDSTACPDCNGSGMCPKWGKALGGKCLLCAGTGIMTRSRRRMRLIAIEYARQEANRKLMLLGQELDAARYVPDHPLRYLWG
jgi:ribosomal protein L16/L10AE